MRLLTKDYINLLSEQIKSVDIKSILKDIVSWQDDISDNEESDAIKDIRYEMIDTIIDIIIDNITEGF